MRRLCCCNEAVKLSRLLSTAPPPLPDTALLAVLEEPVSVFTLDGTYVYISPAGEAILGMRSADLVGRKYLDAFPDLATHPYHAAFVRVAAGESPVERLEFHYPPLDRWSSQRIYPTHGHVMVFWQDITARKHAERALTDSVARIAAAEQQFQTMIEWMPQLAWRARADGFIEYYNPRWYEYTGTTPAAMEGWGWQSVHDPVMLPAVMQRWQHSIDSGEPFEMEFPLRRHDGAMRWFLTRVTPLRDDRGQIVRWIGINTDIDEQKRLLSLLDETLESMGDAFFLLDKDWRIVTVNRNQERVSATSRQHSLGKRFWDVFPATAAPESRYWIHYHRVMEQRVDAHFEEYYAPLDIWTEVDAFPSRDGGIAVFFRDISERKRAELARAESLVREQAARVAAEAANRSKDEFLAMLGHELRNPLAPIMTALQLLRLRGVPEGERELAVIGRQVTHLVRLVDDLLDISRIASGKVTLTKVRLALAGVIERSIETASPLLDQRRHTLVSSIPADIFVDADPPRLEQVFSNLVMNAAKYTPPGGRIEVSAKRDGDLVTIRVSDTGVGIAKELLPRVFEIFVQGRQDLDRAEGGLGLGLTIVQRLVGLHGGEVTAQSDGVGRGATFCVTLPSLPGELSSGAPDLTARAPDASAKRVLVVDDNEDAAEMLADLLQSQGYVTRTAHDGPSALATLESFRPDVAVLDLGLPVMDGFELARLIRGNAELGGIRILALTGYGQAEDRARTADAGFDGHLVKPVDFRLLASFLENR